MPRGGSKRGERRGAAKREANRSVPTKVKRRRGERGSGRRTVEIENEIMRIVRPVESISSHLLPKEQMLDAMRKCVTRMMYWEEIEQEAMAPPITDKSLKVAKYAEEEAWKWMLRATDISFKAAPYIHPRLAALAMVPSDTDNPRGIVQAMLDEIDRRSRDAKMIVDVAANGHANGFDAGEDAA
jgi:hypothetical protein